ncbi:hypothetical protein CEXT_759771 [Caerostris extrusa]|uniref:Telomerase reverse transcriptase n=1 Tax=Caerostris extrusa TaxID=172846 RepID=A0AAV4SRN4_CAEEX|nr:hypothetical protein CEXT_759771 [Caerostris extrusa]
MVLQKVKKKLRSNSSTQLPRKRFHFSRNERIRRKLKKTASFSTLEILRQRLLRAAYAGNENGPNSGQNCHEFEKPQMRKNEASRQCSCDIFGRTHLSRPILPEVKGDSGPEGDVQRMPESDMINSLKGNHLEYTVPQYEESLTPAFRQPLHYLSMCAKIFFPLRQKANSFVFNTLEILRQRLCKQLMQDCPSPDWHLLVSRLLPMFSSLNRTDILAK